MAIELQNFASGDTDYIAKLNSNVSTLTAAINALQAQAGAGGGGGASSGLFLLALFHNADGLVGPDSYKPTQAATALTVNVGGMYIAATQSLVMSLNVVTLNFIGQTSGTKYIVVDSAGQPVIRDTGTEAGTAYSVFWTGSAFSGIPIRIAPAFYDTIEADASRKSTAVANDYGSLDLRLEAGEVRTKDAQDDANHAIDIANDALERMENAIATSGAQKFRKVGVSIDHLPGNKGAIQLDFYGSIVGWSVIADQEGDLQVSVSKKASSPPPAAPSIPSVTTDKISGTASISLSEAQSAARGEAGVASWTKEIVPWDVMQFNVEAVSTLTRATLYVRIKEDIPQQVMTLVFIDATSVAEAPLLVAGV